MLSDDDGGVDLDLSARRRPMQKKATKKKMMVVGSGSGQVRM